jgi:homoserine dehydrogenase
MQQERMDFAAALKLAQEAGYAEADPTLDVGGGDAAHKLTILARLAFGAQLELSQVAMEGIDRVQALDIEFARRFGYVIKPLAIARSHVSKDGSQELELRVHPALIGKRDPLAHIDGALNAVHIDGAALGLCLLSGLGAGALPTAVSVVSDLVDVGRNLLSEATGRVPHRPFGAEKKPKVRGLDERVGRYYLRFSVLDQSGVLGKLATMLGGHDVSIEQMVQDGHVVNERVAVVLLTHPAREANVQKALREIDALGFVCDPTCALRIEE